MKCFVPAVIATSVVNGFLVAPPITHTKQMLQGTSQLPLAMKMAVDNSFDRSSITRRQALLLPVFGAFMTTIASANKPAFADDALLNYKDVAADITSLLASDPDKAPTLLRLAWHSSGTYDKISKSGGSKGATIRFKEELSHGANAGLDKATGWLEPLYKKYSDEGLSYADLYTLGGVVAVKYMGGPTVGWKSGRTDEISPTAVPLEGRLPDADKGAPDATARHLRDIFYRMGFNDNEIVALAGAHAVGRCHADASGYVGPWSPTPTTFNNAYYTLLLNLEWRPTTVETGKFQYLDPSGKLMMLPSDIVLIQDKSFRKYVEKYAKDGPLFAKDFAKAFQKLEELGTPSSLKAATWA